MEAKQEIERRWVVREMDRTALNGPRFELVQGYLDAPEGTSKRIRIIDGREAIEAVKTGTGLVRGEAERQLDLEQAQSLVAETPAVLRKTLVHQDGWHVSLLHEPFGQPDEGRQPVVIERELKSPDESVVFPSWIKRAVEVTDVLSSEVLADFVASREDYYVSGGEWVLHERVIAICGGTQERRDYLATVMQTEFHEVLCLPDIARELAAQNEARMQDVILTSLQPVYKHRGFKALASFAPSFTECWGNREKVPNPFEDPASTILTIILDADDAELGHLWENLPVDLDTPVYESDADVAAVWAKEYSVYRLPEPASRGLDIWAFRQIIRRFLDGFKPR
ncbi:MAG: hypothetical protein WC641_06965 [Patescibacteria group bacterium]